MKRKSKIAALAAMVIVAVGGTITGVAYAAAPPEKCDENIKVNHIYRDGNIARWRTDGQGRPHIALLEQVQPKQGARGQCQKEVGHWGGPGYHGGHLIAPSMGGPDYRYNMVPQVAVVNQSGQAAVERGTLACVKRGFAVRKYKVVALYRNNDIIPYAMGYEFDIYGGGSVASFKAALLNTPGRTPDKFRNGLKGTFAKVGC